MPPPDEAAVDAYLGNGYFPTWCLDVAHRQLLKAAGDPRYAFGETILTVWPPPRNLTGINAITRILDVDEDGDGRTDTKVTIPMPIFHVLGLLSDLGDRYWVLPERAVGGHLVSGFASRDERGVVRVLLYAHHAQDTQSRSQATFDVALDLAGLDAAGPVRVREYPFDRDHNSPYRQARVLRDRPAGSGRIETDRLAALTRALESADPAAQREALGALHGLAPGAWQPILPAVMKLINDSPDASVREAATKAIRSALAPAAYPRAQVEEIRKLTECRPNAPTTPPREPDGHVRLTVRLAGNGCSFLTIEPAEQQ
jgi:hypothetical protein